MEASDVDEDYFTPIKSTPLANIFHDNSNHLEENPSLKYVPPKPEKDIQKAEQPQSSSKCLYSSTLLANEWNGNTYTTKTVGLAVVKKAKTDSINLLIYDQNKVTLSCTTIQPEAEFNVKDDTFISFFDNNKKYWNVSHPTDDIRNLVETLKNLNVQLKPYSENVCSKSCPPGTVGNVISTNTVVDTDSSDNRKKKTSILNRMASMGHPILPSITTRLLTSSDTSDTNDDTKHTTKHRPTRIVLKKKDEQSSQNHVICKTHTTEQNHLVSMITNKNVVPFDQQTTIRDLNTNPEFNLLMTEQRINSSEARINIGRLTEKVDKIFEILNHGNKSEDNNFHNKIYEKLIIEYENKIKRYEEIIQDNTGMQPNSINEKDKTNAEIGNLKDHIKTLETLCQQKDKELLHLKEKISATEIVPDLDKLKQLLIEKEEEIILTRKQNEHLEHKSELDSKLKAVMNATYSLIETQFENDSNYTGCDIKNIVANAIRKVTIDSLNST